MAKIKNLRGERFGRLIVTHQGPRSPTNLVQWFCSCDCGEVVLVRSTSLVSGNTQSCGCLAKELARSRVIVRKLEPVKNESVKNESVKVQKEGNSRLYTYKGESLTLKQWQERTGILRGTLWARVHNQNKTFTEAIEMVKWAKK